MLIQRGGRILSILEFVLVSQPASTVVILFFLLCLGRTAADYAAVENYGGGDCDAMIFAAAQTIFWPICFGCLFVLTRFICGNWANYICPVFNLRVPPRVGANRRVRITAF